MAEARSPRFDLPDREPLLIRRTYIRFKRFVSSKGAPDLRDMALPCRNSGIPPGFV
jgi:hypothetical protein